MILALKKNSRDTGSSGTKSKMPTIKYLFNMVLEVLTSETEQEKEINCTQIGKEEVKLSLTYRQHNHL